ncbi:hypothetical protein [Paenibacillus medicaginis]|uniref:Uncharacterized protein n=1 Tax=Paenibacillus medicaginis TaxID=1470560 RepID=A0ABV5BUX7_9BACL
MLLVSKTFQLNNKKYTYHLETDLYNIHVSCFNHEQEEHRDVDLNNEIQVRAKIIDTLNKNYGSQLSRDIFGNRNGISAEVRREFNIPFPDSEMYYLHKVETALIQKGLFRLSEDRSVVYDYLEFIDIKIVSVEFKGNIFLCSKKSAVDELLNEVNREIEKAQKIIKEMQVIEDKLLFLPDKLQ